MWEAERPNRIRGHFGSKGNRVNILGLGTLIWPQGTVFEMLAGIRKGVLSSRYGFSSVEELWLEIRKSCPKSTSLCGGFRVFWSALENRRGFSFEGFTRTHHHSPPQLRRTVGQPDTQKNASAHDTKISNTTRVRIRIKNSLWKRGYIEIIKGYYHLKDLLSTTTTTSPNETITVFLGHA